MAKRRSGRPLPRSKKPRSKRKHARGRDRNIQGTIRISSRGFGFVETPEGDFYVRAKDTGGALHGDTVMVRPLKNGSHGPEGAVVKLVERELTTLVGTYRNDHGLQVVMPANPRIHHDFFLDPSDRSAQTAGVADGDTVLARILMYPGPRSSGVVTIERRVGGPEDTALPIETIIATHGFATEFPRAALEEAESMRLDIAAALENPLRADLRSRDVFTIDPVDAKDFDDAVSVEPREGGGWVLGVHIADVSHYVPWDGPVDVAARQRATSVYLVDRVLPMLPESLSNELCSLKPHEDRVTMTVEIQIDPKGRVLGSEVIPSIIKSRARLHYDQALAILEGTEEPPVGLDFDLKQKLHALDRIASLREERRRERGAILFDTVEARVDLDEDGTPTGISVREKNRATTLIEEAMLVANEAVARLLDMHGYASAFRAHPDPSIEALVALLPILQEFGYADPETVAGLEAASPYTIQSIVERAEGKPEEYLINSLLLRSMKRAEYRPVDEGHYGLGADAYLHFTSPIRRYPDMIVHRTLKALLANDQKTHGYSRMKPLLADMCKHSSIMEREAESASMESQRVKMAEYMGQHVGEKFSGVVSGVDTYGLFVRLDETTAEGLLPIRKLGDDYYNFDHEMRMLVGEDTGKMYRLGQRIAVVVESVDIPLGRIDFELA